MNIITGIPATIGEVPEVTRSLRILHAADFHLGSPFSTLPQSRASVRRAEQQDTFLDMIRLCEENSTQILLIAGDLLDAVRISPEQQRLLVRAFEKIPGTHVFISPGNHDPYFKSSLYEAASWPENVYIFKGAWEGVRIESLNVIVWGAAFHSARQLTTLCPPGFHVSSMENTDADTIHLGVIHGELIRGKQKDTAYNPIRPDFLENSGLDYVALGHVHDACAVTRTGRTRYAYSGCPEARGYDEAGPRGIYVGTVGKSKVDLTYVYLNKRNFHTLPVPVDGCGTQGALFETVRGFLEEKFGGDFEKSAYRVTLTGAVPQDFVPNTEALRSKLKDICFDARVYDETTAMIDPKRLRAEKSPRGVFADKLLQDKDKALAAGNEELAAAIDLALKLGLRSFEGEVQYHEDF